MTFLTSSPRLLGALALAAALLIAVAVLGCGGDTRRSEADSTETKVHGGMMSGSREATGPVVVSKVTAPARRRYVARVDSICGQLDPERRNEQDRIRGMVDSHQAMMAYDGSVALGWKELRQIEAIVPPHGDAALLRANVFGPIRSQLMLRERMSKALGAADVPRLRAMRARMDNMSRAMSGFARGYGFRVCGED